MALPLLPVRRVFAKLLMIAATVGLLTAQKKTAGSRSLDLNALVGVLGSEVPLAKKREASQQLIAAGKAAIPVLIGALRDPRVYERRDVVNRTNLPGFEPPPKAQIASISVGSRCQDLLYEIITPAASPIDAKFKVFSEQKLKVDDWDAWWAANQGKSLAGIHAELKPLVDEYWKRHGTSQNVKSAGDPAEWEQGIPLPKGALANSARGPGPSRNDSPKTFEVAAPFEAITAFYARHLPKAERFSEASAVKFSATDGTVRLTRSGAGTRISLILGRR